METDADKRELASPSRGVSNAAPASHAAPDIDEMKLELKKIRSTQSERKTELENLHKKKDFAEEKFSLLTVNAKKKSNGVQAHPRRVGEEADRAQRRPGPDAQVDSAVRRRLPQGAGA